MIIVIVNINIKYNDVPNTGLNKSLDEAQSHDNWIVVSMKDDFNTIFESNPSKTSPTCDD